MLLSIFGPFSRLDFMTLTLDATTRKGAEAEIRKLRDQDPVS
jgi:hypothetical protein